MPDLLIELFCEEIPARMQRRAADDLRRLVTDALVERGFTYEGARAAATPRRLALHVAGLPAKGQDLREQRRGPRVGAPEAALQGFLKSAGVVSVDQVKVQSDPKKGDFYVALIERPGRPTPDVLAEIIPDVVRSFPWPKSMRWGPASAEPGSLRWVRPLHSVLCTFGPETEEPEVVPFDIDGIPSGDVTRGHRFMAPEPIRVRRFEDYVSALERAKVVLDPDRRQDMILHDARDLAFAQGLELVEDEALLHEVAGLVEWPVVLMGSFDERFLAIPEEVVRATIRANQKCFVLRRPSSSYSAEARQTEEAGGIDAGGGEAVTPFFHFPPDEEMGQLTFEDGGALAGVDPSPVEPGSLPAELELPTAAPEPSAAPEAAPLPPEGEGGALANRFILVSNLEARDGGRAIVAGNERVVRARLSDATFFWETDQKPLPEFSRSDLKPLDQRLERLRALEIVFHEKLGTQAERVERIAALAGELSPQVGAEPDLALRASRLAKADLVTEMVGEFPELQGLMGRYYAEIQGEDASVAAAIEEHYKPLGPSDRVPHGPVSVAVALADKIDTLVGFWAIGETPTGSKDPYALRRAALGVIRLILDNGLRLHLVEQFLGPLRFALIHANLAEQRRLDAARASDPETAQRFAELAADAQALEARVSSRAGPDAAERSVLDGLLAFFADRLKVYLRDQGARHDLIDAVFALGSGGGTSVIRGEPKAREGDGDAAHDEAGSSSPVSLPAGDDSRRQPLDDLLMVVRRVEALGRFLDTEDGQNLLSGYRRAANILRIEEKKDGASYDGAPDLILIAERGQIEEKALAVALAKASQEAREAVSREDFEAAMLSLSRLRGPVDAFFDKVTVNTEDPEMRANRLKLLNAIRAATREVADFSRIEG